MNQNVQKRPRIFKGALVASSRSARNIAAKRLNVVITYVHKNFYPEIIREEIIGINTESRNGV
jgi:hypothetical protein